MSPSISLGGLTPHHHTDNASTELVISTLQIHYFLTPENYTNVIIAKSTICRVILVLIYLGFWVVAMRGFA